MYVEVQIRKLLFDEKSDAYAAVYTLKMTQINNFITHDHGKILYYPKGRII